MKTSERFLAAVQDFIEQDEIIQNFRRSGGRCSEKEKPDYSTGYPGNPPCNLDDPSSSRCERCQAKVDNRQDRKLALARRVRAKRNMVNNWRRLNAPQPEAQK